MDTVPEKLCVYGGLNTGHEALEGLAEAIKTLGLVTSGADVRTFTLSEMSRDQVLAAELAQDSLAVAHSMGNLIWRSVNDHLVTPSGVIALNPIMPESLLQLAVGGGKRFVHHWVKSQKNLSHAAAHRQIVSDTKESIRDPHGNLGRVAEAGRYSSRQELSGLALRTTAVGLVSDHDEFGQAYEAANPTKRVHFVIDQYGCHDGALYDPVGTLTQVADLGILPRAA